MVKVLSICCVLIKESGACYQSIYFFVNVLIYS